MLLSIPLAWLQLTREKIRLIVALAGIAFAVILIFMQLGFMNALYEGAMAPHNNLQGDLVMINPQTKVLFSVQSFKRDRLYQALGVEGVESVNPVYVSLGNWKNPKNRTTRSLLVFAFDPASSAFKFPDIDQNLDLLKQSNIVLFDRFSRKEFGPVAELFEAGTIVETEVEKTRVKVGGLFGLGASFAADGNIITSDSTFLNIFKIRGVDDIDVGLITVKPNANPKELIKTLSANLPKDIKIMSIQDFALLEKQYWENSAAIGFIFGLGVMMGFIVGAVIVYQILYTDVSNHLAEYATLKAMGYKQSFLSKVVFEESIILAVLGYIPGFLLSEILYELTRQDTNLPVVMTIGLAFFVLILTIIMCFIAGSIAIRRLKYADPADIF